MGKKESFDLKEMFYKIGEETRKQNSDRFDNSCVSISTKPAEVTIEEANRLAAAYDMTIGDMAEILIDLAYE